MDESWSIYHKEIIEKILLMQVNVCFNWNSHAQKCVCMCAHAHIGGEGHKEFSWEKSLLKLLELVEFSVLVQRKCLINFNLRTYYTFKTVFYRILSNNFEKLLNLILHFWNSKVQVFLEMHPHVRNYQWILKWQLISLFPISNQ